MPLAVFGREGADMKKNVFLRLYEYIREYRYSIIISFVCALLSVMSALTAPLIVGRAVDAMAGEGKVDFTLAVKTILLLAAVYLGGNFFLWLLNFITNRVSYRTVDKLRRLLFEKLQRLSLTFFDRSQHGDITSRFVNDIDIISDGMLQGFAALLSGVLTIAGSAGFMICINPYMALTVILSAPVSFFAARFIAVRSQKLFSEQAKQLGLLNGYAEEMIEGQKVVKAFNYENKAYENFKKINGRLYKAGLKSQFISSLSNPSSRIVNNLTYAAVGVIGGLAAITGRVTVGEISSFLIYAVVFSKPFNDITNILTQLQSAAASAHRVFRILDLDPEKPDAPDASELHGCTGHIRFENVKFSYDSHKKLIENFNLDIPSGSSIAIVGHTGAGKTTLVNLLMRFYEMDGGRITVDGNDIRDIKRSGLRSSFGMVLQDTWLFRGTISDNIAYAKPQASMDEIITASKAAGADVFIRRLENGYDTVISEDGGSLSQGEMQLLTIARVILANPPMIILDEATSNIDTYTEMQIQKAFAKITEGRTSFVIAHRLSTVRNADMIIVMDSGSIAESGTHDELLNKEGLYAELYKSQFAGQAI